MLGYPEPAGSGADSANDLRASSSPVIGQRSTGWWQAASWSPSNGCNNGISVSQRPTSQRGQRGWNTHAGGGATGEGTSDQFFAAFLNSIRLAGIATTVTLTLSVLSGYAFARLRFRGRRVVLLAVVGTIVSAIALVKGSRRSAATVRS